MAKWLRLDCVTPSNPKMFKAGPLAMQVAIALWQLANLHDRDDGDVTDFWDDRQIGQQTLWANYGQPGLALVRAGMELCLKHRLVDVRKPRGRRSRKPQPPLPGASQRDDTDQIPFPRNYDPPLQHTTQVITEFDLIEITVTERSHAVTERSRNVTEQSRLLIHNFEKYQHGEGKKESKDTTATERKRRQRTKEKARRQGDEGHGDVTQRDIVTSRDVTPLRYDTIRNVTIPNVTIRDLTKQDHTNKKKQVSVGSTTAAGACTRAPLHTHTHFFSSLMELIQEAHPTQDLGEPSTHEAQAKAKAASGVDLAEAAVVAEWAFKHSEQWGNGQHWRDIIRSPDRFWRNFDELRAQYAGHKQRKGQRVKPLRANSSAPKLKSIDPVKYFEEKEKLEREKLEAENG